MFLYWSPIAPTGVRSQRAATVIADGSTLVLGPDWGIVASSVLLPGPLPTGAIFLFNDQTDLDTTVPNVIRNRINSNLAVTIPNGATWREMLNRLMTVEGAGRWGTLQPGELTLYLGIGQIAIQ